MQERDFVAEFKKLIEQYKMSPFGFRMRKTGAVLKLAEYNGLFYIDTLNIYKIINELMGPNIPEEIIEYIEQITFTELITVVARDGCQNKSMSCVQFLDYSFFNNCANWINDHVERRNEGAIDNGMDMFDMVDPLLALQIPDLSIPTSTVNEMVPFHDLLFGNNNNTKKAARKNVEPCRDRREMLLPRPRGKHMNIGLDELKERPYACEVPFCDRAFKRFEHLKRHMKMHTGDRPYKCNHPGCYKTFSRSDNLVQHRKTHGGTVYGTRNIEFENNSLNIQHLQ